MKWEPAVSHVVFVVSTPERHTGVTEQALDNHFCLLERPFREIIYLRIEGTAEHEIMPHHDTQLVASIVKCIRFVNTATPGSEQIAIQVC